MSKLVEYIVNKSEPILIKQEFSSLMETLIKHKLVEMKKDIIAKQREPVEELELEVHELDEIDLPLQEFQNVIKRGRQKIIRIRIRNGKVQKNTHKSAVHGYKYSHGHIVRMTTQEKMRRKAGQRRGKLKRNSKLSQMLRKRGRSIRKRTTFHLNLGNRVQIRS